MVIIGFPGYSNFQVIVPVASGEPSSTEKRLWREASTQRWRIRVSAAAAPEEREGSYVAEVTRPCELTRTRMAMVPVLVERTLPQCSAVRPFRPLPGLPENEPVAEFPSACPGVPFPFPPKALAVAASASFWAFCFARASWRFV